MLWARKIYLWPFVNVYLQMLWYTWCFLTSYLTSFGDVNWWYLIKLNTKSWCFSNIAWHYSCKRGKNLCPGLGYSEKENSHFWNACIRNVLTIYFHSEMNCIINGLYKTFSFIITCLVISKNIYFWLSISIYWYNIIFILNFLIVTID